MTQKEKAVHFNNAQEIKSGIGEQSENEEQEQSSSNEQYLTNVSSSAIKSGGDMHSVSSICTSILDDAEEIKELKSKIAESECTRKLLEISNEKLNLDLKNEKAKNLKLEKKLQFVKDNQEVFIRLKEAYINMKYNEAAGRKMIEVREKSVQTWEGIICRACIETEELRRKMESLKDSYNNAVIISSTEIEQLINTVNYMSDLVSRREVSWISYVKQTNQLQSQVSILQNENSTLKTIIKTQQETAENKVISDIPLTESNKELNQLKKIIVKYEKRFSEMDQKQEDIANLTLNNKERKIVNHLMMKYNSSVQRNKSRSVSGERNSEVQKIRSRSGSRIIKYTTPAIHREEHSKVDATMQMMEYLFEGCTK